MDPMALIGFLIVGWLAALIWCLHKIANAFMELQIRMWDRDN